MLSLIDLFAGCGGMTLGFERTGKFKSTFAVESNQHAAETFRQNFGGHVFAGRIEAVKAFPQADVVIGGPPCQGFSPLNTHMGSVGLERRTLWQEFLCAVHESQARAFVMENVPELIASGELVAFKRIAQEIGFRVDARVLNAADYGVPQLRRRAFVVGTRNKEFQWPEQTHFEPGTGVPAWKTFREAVEGLPLEPNGENWHRKRPRGVNATTLERYRTIPNEGEGRFELAARRPDLTPDCWLRKKTGSTDVFGRLWWDQPTFTIRTQFQKPEKGRYLHPSEHRSITVREAARCQGFPDDFVFPESQRMTNVAQQIGNAVPPPLAQAIAEALAEIV